MADNTVLNYNTEVTDDIKYLAEISTSDEHEEIVAMLCHYGVCGVIHLKTGQIRSYVQRIKAAKKEE